MFSVQAVKAHGVYSVEHFENERAASLCAESKATENKDREVFYVVLEVVRSPDYIALNPVAQFAHGGRRVF